MFDFTERIFNTAERFTDSLMFPTVEELDESPFWSDSEPDTDFNSESPSSSSSPTSSSYSSSTSVSQSVESASPVLKLHHEILYEIFIHNADMGTRPRPRVNSTPETQNQVRCTSYLSSAPSTPITPHHNHHHSRANSIPHRHPQRDDGLFNAVSSSQVCRSWRSVALTSSQIWARSLNLSFLAQLSDEWRMEVLRRTGTEAGLHVSADIWFNQSRNENDEDLLVFLTSILQLHWRRIESLIVRIDDDSAGPNGQTGRALDLLSIPLRRPTQSLRYFELEMHQQQQSHGREHYRRNHPILPHVFHVDTLFSGCAPLLREFRATQVVIPLSSAWLANLTHLNIHEDLFHPAHPTRPPYAVHDILNMLRTTPNLTHLHLWSAFHANADDTRRSSLFAMTQNPVGLPFLQSLVLDGNCNSILVFLSSVSIPHTPDFSFHLNVLGKGGYEDEAWSRLGTLLFGTGSYLKGYFERYTVDKLDFCIAGGEICISSASKPLSSDLGKAPSSSTLRPAFDFRLQDTTLGDHLDLVPVVLKHFTSYIRTVDKSTSLNHVAKLDLELHPHSLIRTPNVVLHKFLDAFNGVQTLETRAGVLGVLHSLQEGVHDGVYDGIHDGLGEHTLFPKLRKLSLHPDDEDDDIDEENAITTYINSRRGSTSSQDGTSPSESTTVSSHTRVAPIEVIDIGDVHIWKSAVRDSTFLEKIPGLKVVWYEHKIGHREHICGLHGHGADKARLRFDWVEEDVFGEPAFDG